MPSPLETFLHQYTSGHNVLTPEMFQHFGGDDLLAQIKKYDPNATWTDVVAGGEGQEAGKRLDFDITKLPKIKTPSGSETGVFGINPANLGKLRDESAVMDDPLYGKVTPSWNTRYDPSLMERYAPLIAAAISMGGPALAGALASAGIGGTAGLTAGVTGSGLTGVNSLGIPDWLVKQLGKAPSTARNISNGKLPSPISGLTSLAQLFGK
jgi:hypothetical protein